MHTHRRLGVIALVLLVVLAGCSGAGGPGLGGAGGGDGGRENPDLGAGGADGGGDSGAPAEGDTSGGSEFEAIQQRAIIYTGTVSLTVEDFEASSDEVVALAEAQGGFVSNTDRETNRVDNESWTRGTVTIRVPSENFTETFETLKEQGELETASYDTEDVTDQLVDIEARLGNLRAQRDRLRTLYEQANETEDVLAVADRLSEVQGEIERLEAQKQSLEQRVAFSTITVKLSEPRPEPTPEPRLQYHEVGLVTAFLASVDGVVIALQSLAVTFAYAAPYVLVFGLPLAALVLVAWRRR
jgi:hypothetical protein